MRFVKMHGIGNDYVYLDALGTPGLESRDLPALARAVSDRHTGIGSDGLILVCRPTLAGADVRMRMFNADGSESEMCGNGIRCVAKFAHDRLGVRARPMRIQTGRGILAIEYTLRDDRLESATVDMGEPILEASRVPVSIPELEAGAAAVEQPMSLLGLADAGGWAERCGLVPRFTCVSMGNPHAVLFCRDAAAVPLESVGPAIERAGIFPRRTNVHFVQVAGPERAVMRTWERGAGITMACGTGACAVLVAGVLTGRLSRRARLRLPGGELSIAWDERSGHVFKTGPAMEVFEGEWPE
jgi:diaminopimelate epimerase